MYFTTFIYVLDVFGIVSLMEESLPEKELFFSSFLTREKIIKKKLRLNFFSLKILIFEFLQEDIETSADI